MTALFRLLTKPLTLALISFAWVMRKRENRRRFVIGVLIAVTTTVALGELMLDHRHLPWRPLAIDDRAGFATDFKLRLINLGPASWCRNLLEDSRLLRARHIDAHDEEGGCGWPEAYHIEKSGEHSLTGSSVYPMRCELASGAHIWITSIDARARSELGSGLARVHHVGTYSCRRMYNRKRGKMSKHAYAQAWDVTGFELEDGRVISVLKHWEKRGPKRNFLRAVRDDACRIFNVVLGPDYNAAHRDHFHVDMGGGVACR